MRIRLVARYLHRWLLHPSRKPDMLIGDDGDPCMLRWRLIPQNALMNIYLHHMLKPDAGGVLHDHPWPSISLMLSGAATELFDTGYRSGSRVISEGALIYRSASMAHRLAPYPPGNPETWTLFVTGPSIREWGFHCPQGWRHWKAYTSSRPDGSGHFGCS